MLQVHSLLPRLGARPGLAAIVLAAAGPAFSADPIEASWTSPALDRWMYPFATTPGVEIQAPTFGAVLLNGFDDMDAQFIVGFDTGEQIEPGLGADRYQVLSVRVTATITNDLQFAYDPTYDGVATYFDTSDPDYVADADPGRPVAIYGAGYRSGFDVGSFKETSPFSAGPCDGIVQNCRVVYAALLDSLGAATDVSNMVRERFDATPMSIGLTEAVPAGEFVPANSTFTFDLDLCQAATRAYVERALDGGRLNLVIIGLHSATGGPDGGIGDPTYPIWYTRENLLAKAPFFRMATLEISANVGDLGDFNNDGAKNIFDFLAFQGAVFQGLPSADVNGDCAINIFDFLAFQGLFSK
jgi:hypothetical protein